MSDQARPDEDGIGEDIGPAATTGELVHWMEPKPLRVGPAGVSAAAAGAFALGVIAAVTALTLLHMLGPERRVELPRRWLRRA
jgi:hypothetical protein